MTFGALLTWILWRFRPVLWLDGVVARLIGWALRLLEDEDHREWLRTSPANCAWFGGWLAMGEARLNELIHYRACELLNLGCQGRRLPAFSPVRGVRTLDQAILRFARLAERYQAIERLAQLRASKLRTLLEDADPLGRADLRPPPPPPPTIPPAVVVIVIVIISAQRIRAPPFRRTPENQAAQPADSIGENERSCPPYSALKSPLAPPDFASSRTPSIRMPRSTAFSMS